MSSKIDKSKRDSDGVLILQGGRYYRDPGEALKTHRAGELVLTCTESVFDRWSSAPCSRKPTHDPDARGFPTKCGIHCAAAKERKKAKSEKEDEARRADYQRRNELKLAEAEIEVALRKIADGYNDARGLAQEVMARVDGLRGNRKDVE